MLLLLKNHTFANLLIVVKIETIKSHELLRSVWMTNEDLIAPEKYIVMSPDPHTTENGVSAILGLFFQTAQSIATMPEAMGTGLKWASKNGLRTQIIRESEMAPADATEISLAMKRGMSGRITLIQAWLQPDTTTAAVTAPTRQWLAKDAKHWNNDTLFVAFQAAKASLGNPQHASTVLNTRIWMSREAVYVTTTTVQIMRKRNTRVIDRLILAHVTVNVHRVQGQEQASAGNVSFQMPNWTSHIIALMVFASVKSL